MRENRLSRHVDIGSDNFDAFVQVAQFQSPAWVAGATQQIPIDRLPSVADGMPLHVSCIDCEICLTVTDDDDTEEPGINLIDCLENLRIRDILGNEIVNLRGRHLQMLIKMATGWRHADPAALPGTDDGSHTRSIQFRIPFHGGPGGILSMRKFKDAWLTVDRIRGVPVELTWSAAAYPTSGAVITNAVLTMSFKMVPYKTPVVGSDIRYSYIDQANVANGPLEFPIKGQAVHTAGVMRPDRAHGGGVWTNFTVNQFGFLSQSTLFQQVEGWNEGSALDVAQMEPIAAPVFGVPVVYQDRRFDITGVVTFQMGRLVCQSVHTEPDPLELMMLEVYDTRDLALKLMGRPQTVFQGARYTVADYAAKNQPGRGGPGVGGAVASKLNHLLSQQLRRNK